MHQPILDGQNILFEFTITFHHFLIILYSQITDFPDLITDFPGFADKITIYYYVAIIFHHLSPSLFICSISFPSILIHRCWVCRTVGAGWSSRRFSLNRAFTFAPGGRRRLGKSSLPPILGYPSLLSMAQHAHLGGSLLTFCTEFQYYNPSTDRSSRTF